MEAQIHSTESLATLDGPGLRTVVFFQGCPLRCKYCHNIDCVVSDSGKTFTVEELFNKIIKNKPYWGVPGETRNKEIKGGMTLSGGDPLFQFKFVTEFVKRLKQEKVHIAMDTALMTKKSVIDDLLPYVDLWMVSVKHLDDEKHKFLTSVTNKKILENLEYLDTKLVEMDKPESLRLRFVLIPGWTDSPEYLEELAEFVKNFHTLEYFEILGYTEIGRFKWIENFGKYPMEGTPEPTRKDLERVKAFFREKGIPTKA